MVVHLGYYIALAGAYRHGDLGLTYPVMRGCAPLLVAMGSLRLHRRRHLGASAGPAWSCICARRVTLGLSRSALRGGDEAQRRKALGFALANAAIIAL